MAICDWFQLTEPIQAKDEDGEVVVLTSIYVESDCGPDGDRIDIKGLRDASGKEYSEKDNADHFSIGISDVDAWTMDTITDAVREDAYYGRRGSL